MSGLVELFSEIGNDNLEYQNLISAMEKITKTKDGASRIQFLTESITPNDVMSGDGKVGIVVWVDRDKFQSALDVVKSKKPE
ncbi:MAG: hypothetical protein ACRDCI_12010 [Plesiomonas shigelloides]